ncbi:hypothetical protein V8E53_009242 [Lactarius tabidus]
MTLFKVTTRSKGSQAFKQVLTFRTDKPRHSHATTISILSDDVLLEIFDIFRKNYEPPMRNPDLPEAIWHWHTLVHVCQSWRKVVFASPRRLSLQLRCTHGTPVRKNLDIWPTFPIDIEYHDYRAIKDVDEDNIIAALEHPDRVSAVSLSLTGSQLGKMVTVMQEQFPTLRHLFLTRYMYMPSHDVPVPVLPSEFLGRSAPCLQKFGLYGIPFPALPSLLVSTSDLVTLEFFDVPQSGYVSPEAMVAGLATLTRLEYLNIGFRSVNSRPDRTSLTPTTRTLLPALTSFKFGGAREYLEDFAARIDAPLLNSISIDYFNQLVEFEVPQLSRFIRHSESLKRATRCSLDFLPNYVSFTACPGHVLESPYEVPIYIYVHISCDGIDWQTSHLTLILSQISAMLPNTVHLAIDSSSTKPEQLEDMNDIEWPQLLRPFTSVKTMLVCKEYAGIISCALEHISGVMATEILPALDVLCLEDQPVSSVDNFIAARRDAGLPATVVSTRGEFEERVKVGPIGDTGK